MARAYRLQSLRTVLSREGWATVLVLAGAGLLVFPPDQAGVRLVAWTLGMLVASFLVVVVGSRLWPPLRG